MVDVKQAQRVVQLMVLAAWADGRVAGSEAIVIQKMVNGLQLLEGLGPIAELCRDTRTQMVEDGLDECMISAARALRDREYKELAFQCCARVIGADSEFASEEEEFLRKLQQLFAINVEDMRRLLVLATREPR